MNRKLKPWHSFIISGISYLLSWLIGGLAGTFLGLLGFICLLLGIGTFISNGLADRKKELEKRKNMVNNDK